LNYKEIDFDNENITFEKISIWDKKKGSKNCPFWIFIWVEMITFPFHPFHPCHQAYQQAFRH
jgi:hypothetical protein